MGVDLINVFLQIAVVSFFLHNLENGVLQGPKFGVTIVFMKCHESLHQRNVCQKALIVRRSRRYREQSPKSLLTLLRVCKTEKIDISLNSLVIKEAVFKSKRTCV